MHGSAQGGGVCARAWQAALPAPAWYPALPQPMAALQGLPRAGGRLQRTRAIGQHGGDGKDSVGQAAVGEGAGVAAGGHDAAQRGFTT